MEWKYKKVFLLLCLLFSSKINAQNCLTFRYDDSGNRMEMLVSNCGSEYKEQGGDVTAEISMNNKKEGLSVYPNPSKGTFVVELNNCEAYIQPAIVQVYNDVGVMIKEDRLIENLQIDITNNPAGAYLLRIIKDDSVYDCIVVKI